MTSNQSIIIITCCSLLRPHQFLHPPIASTLKFLDQRLLTEPLMPQLCLGPFIWSSESGSENTGDPTKFGHGKLVIQLQSCSSCLFLCSVTATACLKTHAHYCSPFLLIEVSQSIWIIQSDHIALLVQRKDWRWLWRWTCCHLGFHTQWARDLALLNCTGE